LSGGQRQRVAIGRAIVRNPRVFLFDEPLSNLDAALRVATRMEIAKLKDAMPDTTMIYVTHDQVEAMTLADRIVVLKDGCIEQVGTPMELYKQPCNLFVAQFIGSPAMNILPASIERAGAATAVKLAGGMTAQLPLSTPETAKGAAVNLGVRPEDLRIAGNGDDALLQGRLNYIEQLGEVQLAYLDIGGAGQPLIAKLPGGLEIQRGAELRLTASAEDVYLFDESGRSFAAQETAASA
jgi:multiple sugar transport system ATP-binding protein/alpha-glucoside transport system ATP-binding protein